MSRSSHFTFGATTPYFGKGDNVAFMANGQFAEKPTLSH